ncbi:MAG: hypothetical protein ACM3Y8_08600 [Byssovorax cruenta]
MKRFILLILTLTLILAACASPQATPAPSTSVPAAVSNSVATPTDDPALLPTLFPNTAGSDEMTRMDEQGAVIFEVTPLNLGTPVDTLDFDVAMNTHSIDLSMDLAVLSTLTTDTGITIPATKWDGAPGGHHVSGTLIFPAMQDGKSIIEGSSRLTLTIVNVDAPARVFEWELK